MERSGGWKKGLFFCPSESEGKFIHVYQTARSEDMAYMVYQHLIVANLMTYEYNLIADEHEK